ncbi:MAG: hypothetical protein O2800_03405 [Planctomycetota bacterium]|nr:hypothetical protein [Planctomycetota bacterium]
MISDVLIGSSALLCAVSVFAQSAPDDGVVGWQVPEVTISATPSTTGDGFGRSLAMSSDGSTLVIGAPDTRVNSTNGVGAIHVYQRDGSGWTHEQMIECPPTVILPDGTPITASFAQFGACVAVENDTIVVGAWGYAGPVDPIFSGRAFVYTRDALAENPWGVTDDTTGIVLSNAELRSETLESIDLLGQSVAIDFSSGSGVIAVGRPLAGSSNIGAIHIFEGEGSTWTEVAQLTAGDNGSPNDQLGTQVAIDSGVLIAGVQSADNANGSNAGEVYTFVKSKAGWPTIPSQVLRATSGASNDGYGSSVSILGDALIIGSSGFDQDAADVTTPGCGTAYTYRKSAGNFTLENQLHGRESFQNDAFGFDVWLASESTALVGAPGFDGGEIGSGAGFWFIRSSGGVWELSRADLWSQRSGVNEALGRQVAASIPVALGTPLGVLSSEFPAVTGAAAISFGFAYSSAATPAEGGPDLQIGAPATPDAPGANGAEFEGSETGGAPTGGGVPTGGIGSGGVPSFTIPLTPIVEDWGLIRGTLIITSGGSIYGIQTDGLHYRHDPAPQFITTIPTNYQFLGAADLNGDQSGDLLFLDTVTRRLKAMARDGFVIVETVNMEDLPADSSVCATGDFNGNGTDDIILKNGRALSVWFISAFGRDGEATALLPEQAADLAAEHWSFAPVNFEMSFTDSDEGDTDDNDGSDAGLELIAHNSASGVTVRVDFGDSDGNDAVHSLNRGPGIFRGAGDWDNDGTTDLLWQEGDHLVFNFHNAGGTIRQSRSWAFDMSGFRLAAIADIDSNGAPDLFLQSGDDVYVMRLATSAIASDRESGDGRVKIDVAGRRKLGSSAGGSVQAFTER